MSSDSDRPAADAPSALPPGTRLGEFEVLRVLGVGGFGIVYLALDHALEREVAVKEYMPSALAGRTATLHVSLRSQGDNDTFVAGLKSFVNEARLLARFDHPSLLKVHRFWEANGTAYMAMPVYRGRTLKEARARMDAAPDEAWLRALLLPLLGAIGTLHDAGVFHRDIAPDNIVLEGEGRPVLLDFGAARKVIGDKSQALTAILKPAYAPVEQYGEAGSVKQGPWTDFYALGATLHYLLLGRPPEPATARVLHDHQPLLATMPLAGCSPGFLRVLDWMLAPRPSDRPQSVAALLEVLEGRAEAPVRVAPEAPPSAWERTQNFTPTVAAPRPPADEPEDATVIRPVPPRPVPVPVPATVPSAPPAPPAPQRAPAADPVPAPMAAPAPVAAPAARSRAPLIAAVAVVALVAAGWAFWPRTPAAPTTTAAAPPAMEPPGPLASAAVAASPPPEASPPPAATAQPAPPPAAQDSPRPPATAPSATHASPPARPPQRPATAAPGPTVAAETPAPPPAPVAPPRPPAVAATPPAPAPAPAAPETVTGPRERCGSRVLVALSLCMERECKKPELRQHPECVKWRDDLQKLANPNN